MTRRQAIATTIVLALLAFELLVLAILAFFPYVPDPGLATLNMSIYTFLAPLSTVILLGLLYAWLVRFGTREIRRRSSRFNDFVRFLSEPFQKIVSSIKSTALSESARSLKVLSYPRLMLGISLVVSVLIVFVPYRPDLNPAAILVGIDSPTYVGWISLMLGLPLLNALQYSFVQGLDGSRPLLLVLFYLVGSAGVSPSQIIEYTPMLLAPLLSLSAYTFVRYGNGSARFAGLTALFSSVSFYSTVGLWGGYYANWLALILVYFFLTSLLVFSRSPSKVKYGTMYALSVALFLTHPWTWVLIAAVCLVFSVTLWKETRNLVHLKSLTGIIATGIILDLVKSWAFSSRSVAADIATKAPNGAGVLLSFWNNLVDGLLFTHGALLANWLVLGLGLLGVLVLRFKDWFERLLLLWVGVPSIAFVLLGSYHQARIVYDLPIPVLTTIAVVSLLPRIGSRNIRWPGLILLLLVFVSASYALQGVLLL